MKSKKHFLVVDDSELSLRVVELVLNSFGISGDYVSGADAAFTALSGQNYDLVLIDYLMPGMNGLETVKLIRRMAGGKRRDYFANLPIIILTAEEDEHVVEEMLAGGASDVLPKPLQPEDLKRVMSKWTPRVPGISDEDLEEALSGDPEGFAELIRLFCEDIPDKRVRIEEALKAGDYAEYTVEVHRIKGECNIINAKELSAAAKRLEFIGKAVTGTVPNDLTEEENKKIISLETPKLLQALELMRPALAEEADGILPDDDAAEETGADSEDTSHASRSDIEKILRYVDHALESLNDGDLSLTAEWLGEIKEHVVRFLR